MQMIVSITFQNLDYLFLVIVISIVINHFKLLITLLSPPFSTTLYNYPTFPLFIILWGWSLAECCSILGNNTMIIIIFLLIDLLLLCFLHYSSSLGGYKFNEGAIIITKCLSVYLYTCYSAIPKRIWMPFSTISFLLLRSF